MKKIFFTAILFFTFFGLMAQEKVVYHAMIEGDIDLGLAPFVRRVINDAVEHKAAAIIFEINTFGGRVDAATQIKDAILESPILTIAYVNKRAISAGALITLSCRKIAMAEGSSIGASTVVDQTGQKVSEKYQSYMRSEMRSTAEKNKRRRDVAEAMVDERVVIPGLVDSTQLVTLTYEEAIKYGISDTTVNSLKEVLAAFDLKDAVISKQKSNWAEDFVRFLNNPIISSLLIMIGLIGMYTEIKTPGWGIAGTLALISLGLFFGTSVILELASVLEILLFVAGVILLLVEIFIIPGFGAAGIIGMLLVFGSLFLALINLDFYFDTNMIMGAVIQLGLAVALSIAIMAVLIKFLPRSSMFNKMILSDETSKKEGFNSNPDYSGLVGKEGITITPLRPAGIAKIDNNRMDVVTEGEYIEKDVKIFVFKTEGARIIVKQKEE